MSAYPLVMLIGVCKLREDSAASAMRAAEANLRTEEENERRLRRELEEYREWRLAEEDRRYAALIGTDTDVAGMEKFRAELAVLKEREVEYEGAIIDSRQRQNGLREKLAQAKKTYQLAVQESRKIDAHRESWMEDWNREQSRLEDVEMEEFAKGTPKAGDGDGERAEVDEDEDYGG